MISARKNGNLLWHAAWSLSSLVRLSYPSQKLQSKLQGFPTMNCYLMFYAIFSQDGILLKLLQALCSGEKMVFWTGSFSKCEIFNLGLKYDHHFLQKRLWEATQLQRKFEKPFESTFQALKYVLWYRFRKLRFPFST